MRIPFEVSIAYPVTYLPRRGRTEKTVLLPEKVQVEILAPEAGDFERVLDVVVDFAHISLSQNRILFGEKFYGESLADSHINGGNAGDAVDHLRLSLADRNKVYRLLNKQRPGQLFEWDNVLDDDALPLSADVIIHNGKEMAIEEAKAALDRLVVVDGQLLSPAGCPVLEVAYRTANWWVDCLEDATPGLGYLFALNEFENVRGLGIIGFTHAATMTCD